MPQPILKLHQPLSGFPGLCYGYSTLWSKGYKGLGIPENIQNNNTQDNVIELIDSAGVRAVQYHLTASCAQRLPNFYMDWEEEVILKDLKAKLQNTNDAVVIVYHGAIGGHVLAIKKVDNNVYHYFDCNTGIYELTHSEIDQLFSHYMHPNYKKILYGFTLEYIPAGNDFTPDTMENIMASVWVAGCKIVTAPTVGIFRYIQSLCELVCSIPDLITGINSPQNQLTESTPLISSVFADNKIEKEVTLSNNLQGEVQNSESSFSDKMVDNCFSFFTSSPKQENNKSDYLVSRQTL
jgi:hypothetical protein